MSVATSWLWVSMTNPFAMSGTLHITTPDAAVSAITKRRISAQAVMNYFSLFRILLYNGNGHGGFRGTLMKSSVVKRSIVIDGHKTSVSLEDPFWTELKNIAHTQQVTLSDLVSKIEGTREQSNLSSAIRLFVLQHFREDKQVDLAKAHPSGVAAEGTPVS